MSEKQRIEMVNEPEKSNEEIVVDDFYDYAMRRNETLKGIPESEIKPFIDKAVKEIDLLEEVAERDKGRFNLPEEIAKDIGTIWVFSGPGTYFEPRKEDRYKNYPWAENMDRIRLNHATRLARKITESVSGQSFKAPLSEIVPVKRRTKEAIRNFGPSIIYNGNTVENEAVAKAMVQEETIVPKEKVDIIEGNIDNTVDQVKTFKLPDEFEKGKEVALVSHAPHLARIVRMINKYRPFPEGTKIRLFPVPTPEEGREEYAKMEVCGTLYYTYITEDATEEPYPYEISYPL